MGHRCLDVLDSGGGSVFAGFGVIVVEVWGAVRGVRRGAWWGRGNIQCIFWARHDCCGVLP